MSCAQTRQRVLAQTEPSHVLDGGVAIYTTAALRHGAGSWNIQHNHLSPARSSPVDLCNYIPMVTFTGLIVFAEL